MPKVLVLGAGLVSRPLVTYLLGLDGYTVTVATRTVSKAEALIQGHANGKALELNADGIGKMDELVGDHDLTVSLLPYSHHPDVADLCIKHKKHMVTTSYISDAMKQRDGPARDADILILNECGLDPGIDHMSALRVIHRAGDQGGKVTSFRSSTGALPSHRYNDNPFGYKFSWSPRGVLLASRNPAKWLEDGREIDIPGEELFENYYIQDVPGAGSFENYPNRNSVPYKDLYGLKDAMTVYRGTFRMTGWCETMRRIVALGWLQDAPLKNFQGATYADVTRFLIGAPVDMDIEVAVCDHLGVEPWATVIKRIKWLGLLDELPLPGDRDNPLDHLNVLTLEKMALPKDQPDMVVMHHEFTIEYDDRVEHLTSTLVDYGQPGGDTSVARTVSLPAAMAVKMILEGRVAERGVHMPNLPGIYDPILDELESLGIRFIEGKDVRSRF